MRAAFYTLGCKVNQYESAVMASLFRGAGFEITEITESADVYVINSCTVTAQGDRKSLQMVRRLRRYNPAAIICLTGCFPQASPEIAATVAEADIVMGSKNRQELLAAVKKRLDGAPRIVDIILHNPHDTFEKMSAQKFPNTRAYLKIQDGCNRKCAYCIIPHARGNVRSKPLAEIHSELAALAAAGYKEAVLVGINLPSYGTDSSSSFLDAIKCSCAASDMRIRLGSLEPELLSSHDIAQIAALPNLCPHFHLSLQSGCDATLRRMRRPYTTEQYTRIVADLRAAFSNCSITTDIMVGFPGETDTEFAQSLFFAQQIGFAKIHVFPFSRRHDTPADLMPDQIPEPIKRLRAARMSQIGLDSRLAFIRSQVGKHAILLPERSPAPGVWEGYSENYSPLRIRSSEDLAGRLIPVKITASDDCLCLAEIII